MDNIPTIALKPSLMKPALAKLIKAGLPFLLKGQPGCGKTDVITAAAEEADFDLQISHPVVADATDYKGLPFMKDGGAEFLPFGDLRALIDAKRPLLAFLDDLGQAPPLVQAACFPAGTPVICSNDVKSIEEIVMGDIVIDADGNSQAVTHLFTHEATELFTIKAVGLLPIPATGNHPFLISTGRKQQREKDADGHYPVISESFGEPTWTEAKDIETGMWLGVPVIQGTFDKPTLEIERRGAITRTVDLTPDFAELVGFYVGDGWFVQHRHVQATHFALDDAWPGIQARLIDLIRRIVSVDAYSSQKKNHKRIGFHDVTLGKFLADSCGDRSWNKKIPSWILANKSMDIVAAFLRGYLATDGALMRDHGKVRGVQWSTVSRTLALQTQALLTRFGTLGTLKSRHGGVAVFRGKNHQTRVSYHLQCSDTRVMNALGEPFEPKREVRWSYEYAGKIWTRIKEVCATTNPDGKVYNLEIAGPHTYNVANAAVHNCMQLILARRIGNHRVSEHVTFAAATNRKGDKAAVSGILEPVKSRFVTILEMSIDVDDWCAWAIENDLPVELIAFCRFKPSLWTQFKPTADITNSPSPRTMAHAAKLVKLGFGKIEEHAMLAGAIGEGAAGELEAFLRIFRTLPNIDAVLMNPDSAAVPDDPSTLFALAGALAHKATPSNFDRVVRYSERMPPEYAVCLIKDALQRDGSLQTCEAFVRWGNKNQDIMR